MVLEIILKLVPTLRGLFFAWIKFHDFANFLAFHEN